MENIFVPEDCFFEDGPAEEVACPQCDSDFIKEVNSDEFDCCTCGCSWRYVAVCSAAM